MPNTYRWCKMNRRNGEEIEYMVAILIAVGSKKMWHRAKARGFVCSIHLLSSILHISIRLLCYTYALHICACTHTMDNFRCLTLYSCTYRKRVQTNRFDGTAEGQISPRSQRAIDDAYVFLSILFCEIFGLYP